MDNFKKYNKAFIDILEVDEKELSTLRLKESKSWDSVGHMMLIAALEETFDIMLEPEDMMSIDTYSKGIEVLSKYGIEL